MESIKSINVWAKGKTVARIDISSENLHVWHFTDGTCVTIEPEHMGMNIYGPVYYAGDANHPEPVQNS